MDLSQIELNDAQLAELSGPFTQKHAQEAALLGMARALAENNLLPSDVEPLLHKAGFEWGSLASLPGQYALLGLGTGAVLGAYSGFARHKMEQVLDGNDDPKVVALKKKIEAYRNMTADLKRTSAVSPGSV
jgi:hypothetical protein